MTVVGLISAYREGRLTIACANSLLACCDRVLVLEGPIGEPHEQGEPSVYYQGRKQPPNLFIREAGPWPADAAKRTELVRWAQRQNPGPCWGVVLDGDEVLLWPELLRDKIERAEQEDHERPGLKIKRAHEEDEQVQVVESECRVLRVDFVEAYVLSVFQIKLKGVSTIWVAPDVAPKRAPIHGEPHILHRAYLRPPARNAPELRQSAHELRALEELGIAMPWRPLADQPTRELPPPRDPRKPQHYA